MLNHLAGAHLAARRAPFGTHRDCAFRRARPTDERIAILPKHGDRQTDGQNLMTPDAHRPLANLHPRLALRGAAEVGGVTHRTFPEKLARFHKFSGGTEKNRRAMYGASLALVVLAAVTTMADNAWSSTPRQDGCCRPNAHAPEGKTWRKSLGVDGRRRQPPALAPIESTRAAGLTEAEDGSGLSGQATEDLVAPTGVAAAFNVDDPESNGWTLGLAYHGDARSGSEEEAEEDGSGSGSEEGHPLAEQQAAADDRGKAVMSKGVREQNKAKFKDEEDVAARAPRTITVLSTVPDEEILAPYMEFSTRAEAELHLAEFAEKHRKNYQLWALHISNLWAPPPLPRHRSPSHRSTQERRQSGRGRRHLPYAQGFGSDGRGLRRVRRPLLPRDIQPQHCGHVGRGPTSREIRVQCHPPRRPTSQGRRRILGKNALPTCSGHAEGGTQHQAQGHCGARATGAEPDRHSLPPAGNHSQGETADLRCG